MAEEEAKLEQQQQKEAFSSKKLYEQTNKQL